MRTTCRAFVIPLAAALVSCRNYTGDGNFKTYGTWPVVTYQLDLPEWYLPDGDTRQYRIRGWKSNKHTYLTLNLRSMEPIVFSELPLDLEVTVTKPDGETVFKSDRDVFAHLKRKQRIGHVDTTHTGEWWCDYKWGGYDNRPGFTFLFGAIPMARKRLSCWAQVKMPDRDYNFFAKCDQCDRFSPISVSFQLGSGWK